MPYVDFHGSPYGVVVTSTLPIAVAIIEPQRIILLESRGLTHRHAAVYRWRRLVTGLLVYLAGSKE